MAVTTKLDSLTEVIDSEREDAETSLYTYEILTYPTDYTLEVLVDKWKKGLIGVPEEQRQFIWTQAQSSKLIESFLMGLPVPPVYFYHRLEDNKLQVVDGLQRLMSIVFFFSGFFGDPTKVQNGGQDGQKARGKARTLPVFSLIGLHKDSPFKDQTIGLLKENDDFHYNKLVNSVLRSFVMKQLQPRDHTSIFQVFERLNSGGMVLQGQEIRNCIYTGTFNKLLKELNTYPAWRQILGVRVLDKRMRDVELVLRFFSLVDIRKYKKPMKEWLNSFMESNRALEPAAQSSSAALFRRTSSAVIDYLGPKPFHIKRGLNVAAFDAVFLAFARNIDRVAPLLADGSMPRALQAQQADMLDRYRRLLGDEDFIRWVSSNTTDDQVVKDRAKKAEEILFA